MRDRGASPSLHVTRPPGPQSDAKYAWSLRKLSAVVSAAGTVTAMCAYLTTKEGVALRTPGVTLPRSGGRRAMTLDTKKRTAVARGGDAHV